MNKNDLLKQIEKAYGSNVKHDVLLQKFVSTINKGNGDYKTVFKVSRKYGEALSKAFKSCLSDDVFEGGSISYDVAKTLLNPMLKANYDNVAPLCEKVQKKLNEDNKLSLNAVKPSYDREKAEGLAKYISDGETYSQREASFLNSLETNSKSIVDQSVLDNCELQAKAGLSPVIERYVVGDKPCDWCQSLAGVYRYPDEVPSDVYQRHSNCNCIVVYKPDANAKDFQDVWSKKWNEEQTVNRIDLAQRIESKDDRTDRAELESNTTKLKGAMGGDYDSYLEYLHNNEHEGLCSMYNKYADDINAVNFSTGGSYYKPSTNTLYFDYKNDRYIKEGMDKYSTLAHEYGHFFDYHANFDGLHFSELDTLRKHVRYFAYQQTDDLVSMSDEFLAAMRADKEHISNIWSKELIQTLGADSSTAGVQDAIDGFFMGAQNRIRWGHGEQYYNRLFNGLKRLKQDKSLREAYRELGYDVSNMNKAKVICRNYETASELWANLLSAITVGGKEEESMKKYMPNSYATVVDILKRVK